MSDILLDINAQEQSLLRQRAEDLARATTQQQTTGQNSFNCLFFEINGIHYAVAQDWVQEVHLEVRPVPVPGTPAFVRGIVNIRGEIVSALDLAAFMGYQALPAQSSYQMLRVRRGKLEFGILCQQIENIQSITPADLHAFEHGDSGRLQRYLLGVTDQLENILDVEVLLSDESLIVC